ncbi:MAG TPA: peptidylprolyl isomerase [Isosphaeraceae bacterium]|nr:peptidylprolyl isomerase [Isosphaeraceae bacterium]
MRRTVNASLLFLVMLGLIAVAAEGQTPAEKAAAPPVGAAAPGVNRPAIPGANDVVAVVTNGGQTDKITKGEIISFLSHYPAPRPEDRETVFNETLDALLNTKLITQFLARQNIAVPPEKVDEEIERLKQQLKTDGQDLATALLQNNVSMNDIRKEYEQRIRWSEYVKSKATEAALRKFYADHRDLFSGTQIRASHILLKVDPNTSEAEKEKIRQKVAGIKNEIDQRKLTFAEAANKYSEDPANAGGAGGDLDYFSLNSGYIEEFTDVAFKLKKGIISDIVETPFGFHLIQVTDRKEGKPVDFDQNKAGIIQAFAAELQKSVVAAERKTAKFDIKPLPRDLFPQVSPAGDADAGAANAKSADSAKPKQ